MIRAQWEGEAHAVQELREAGREKEQLLQEKERQLLSLKKEKEKAADELDEVKRR